MQDAIGNWETGEFGEPEVFQTTKQIYAWTLKEKSCGPVGPQRTVMTSMYNLNM